MRVGNARDPGWSLQWSWESHLQIYSDVTDPQSANKGGIRTKKKYQRRSVDNNIDLCREIILITTLRYCGLHSQMVQVETHTQKM